ncbi:MAG: excinuclease ABC subunit UvrA [Planctomycetes bacterium]|nr:excinuclease ABC subunit UvrA [Planctomycetota bacterium]
MAEIVLRGCRQHNLKGFDVAFPLGKLSVVTGPSGSGKSSLAFDTLFAEGQRRYVETFSAYARQFLDRMERPAVDAVEGIPPAVAIEQGNRVRSSRSTVATVTELNDYVKLLFARLGVRHCDRCDRPVRRLFPAEIADEALQRGGGELLVGFDVEAHDAEETRRRLIGWGVRRIYAGGALRKLEGEDAPPLGDWIAVLDRVPLGPEKRARLLDAIEQSFSLGQGRLALVDEQGHVQRHGTELRCLPCALSYRPPTPQQLSFNDAQGACPRCHGFGRVIEIDPELVVPNPRLGVGKGALKPLTTPSTTWERRQLRAFLERRGIDLATPYAELGEEERRLLWKGEPGGYEAGVWFGIEPWFAWMETRAYKMHVRVLLSRYRTYQPCADCQATGLQPAALKVRLRGKDVAAVARLTIEEAARFFGAVEIPAHEEKNLRAVHDEVVSRLGYLLEVGLGYLTLDRQSRTLSGGEMQRVNLTAAVGSRLVGTLFVLDEPSVGLHPRDNERLLAILRRLVDAGNTAVVVEHEEDVLRAADHLVDLGPGSGELGGELLVSGDLQQVLAHPRSATARVLREGIRLERRERGALWSAGRLVIRGAAAHNLRDIDVEFPLGRFSCLSGVSGSGKSTLLETVLYRNARRARGEAVSEPGAVRAIEGLDRLAEVVWVDAGGPMRTGKSCLATALHVWGDVRELFAATPAARARGFSASTFSFNTPGGRCETCEGLGVERIEMQFLADVETPCPACEGTRFQDEVLKVECDGRSVDEVLSLTLDEARTWLRARAPKAAAKLDLGCEVGLEYLRLGQSIASLSGGEAQRLKIVAALASGGTPRARRAKRGTLYLFDEPSTGLHGADIEKLFRAFQLLLERGDTVIAIEHHLDLIDAADWVVDLGPEGGVAGGALVGAGTPQELRRNEASATGIWLRKKDALVRPPLAVAAPAAGRAAAERAQRVIALSGVRENNLRDLHLEIPREKLCVVTGVSGSGKSTLAFDVLFQEGQRRYLDTLSPYARQFIGQLARADVDRIDGVPPAIAIEQRTTRSGANSTVATITELWHGLRLLFTKVGVQHCTRCGAAVEPASEEQIGARVSQLAAAQRLELLAPVIVGKKGFHKEIFDALHADGIERARVDRTSVAVRPAPALDRYAEHDIDAEVGVLAKGARGDEVRALVARALAIGEGTLFAVAKGRQHTFSTRSFCLACSIGFPAPDPRRFSFNSRHGRCDACSGSGAREVFDEAKLVAHPERRLDDGAIPALLAKPFPKSYAARFAVQVEDALGFSLGRPWSKLGAKQRAQVLHGTEDFLGLLAQLELFRSKNGGEVLEELRAVVSCPACDGARLNPASRAVRVASRSLPELAALTVSEMAQWVARTTPKTFGGGGAGEVWARVKRELEPRLRFLRDVGLDYLRLDRPGPTLSGGEAQRIRIAASLGSNTCGALYVLDEPTIGLHPSDHASLMGTLTQLRDRGNTVVVVEHDEETIARADHVIELGPGAGKWGGRIVHQGDPASLRADAQSPTGRALAGNGRGRSNRRAAPPADGPWLELRGARKHNLDGVDLRVPLGALTVFTGVSGSGKSTLVREVLLESLRQGRPVACEALSSTVPIERVLEVDQTPIGRSPRSIPATYVGIFDEIRALFARSPEAASRGYGPGRFSFNVKGGRCETCQGHGEASVEMSFLPAARVPCTACGGRRFHQETLEIKWGGLSIADVLGLTLEQAREVFANHPRIRSFLEVLCEVGLGYLSLGQESPTLSGGEAQRVKLAQELGKAPRGRAVYILDEPTTGLSLSDVRKLVRVFHRLVERGDSLFVIEHSAEVMGEADWIVDLGPGGGSGGGRVVASGPFAELVRKGARKGGSRTLPVLRSWWERFGLLAP